MFYLDASAAVKLVREEPESAVLRKALEGATKLLSSELLETEIRRAIRRHAVDRPSAETDHLVQEAGEVLARFSLFGLSRDLLVIAGALPDPDLRSLDAIHIATALAAHESAPVFVSYDTRQLRAGKDMGLHVLSPQAKL